MLSSFTQKILIIGCGNMAGAMLKGWLAAGLAPGNVTILNPSEKGFPKGTHYHSTIRELKGKSYDFAILGVKPQKIRDVAKEINASGVEVAHMVSILAGTGLEELSQILPHSISMTRVMPNMAVSIGKSPMGIVSNAAEEVRGDIDTLMATLGPVFWLKSEDDMHIFTALSGSGPAYVFRFIDALAEGAVAGGMDRDMADRLALAMVEGAGILARGEEGMITPGDLADKVASPGGTTREGLNILDKDRAIFNLMENTLAAAARRSREMAEE